MLIDVRTKEEYDAGHLEGAMLFTLQYMIQGSFPNVSKDEKIVLYCQSGSRSMMAKNLMENFGFTNVTNGGGIHELIKI